MKNELLSSGKFAEYVGTSRKTLIYYDEIGLLKPYLVKENGYRYYLTSQILEFSIIRAYQNLGLNLDEIKLVLEGNSSEIDEIVNEKLNDIDRQIRDLEITKRIVLQTRKSSELLSEHGLDTLFFEHHDAHNIIISRYDGTSNHAHTRSELAGGIYYTENGLETEPYHVFHFPMFPDEKTNAVIDEGDFVCAIINTITVYDAVKKFMSLTEKEGYKIQPRIFFFDMSNDMIIDGIKGSIIKVLARIEN
ncbi:MAG: MerR family transcriptional regulator [Clostridia bacterium]|nr:MerR family transcriptional regulator [Clostridia bacterium]